MIDVSFSSIGAMLLIIAGFIRFIQRKQEPAYALALAGGIMIAISQVGWLA